MCSVYISSIKPFLFTPFQGSFLISNFLKAGTLYFVLFTIPAFLLLKLPFYSTLASALWSNGAGFSVCCHSWCVLFLYSRVQLPPSSFALDRSLTFVHICDWFCYVFCFPGGDTLVCWWGCIPPPVQSFPTSMHGYSMWLSFKHIPPCSYYPKEVTSVGACGILSFAEAGALSPRLGGLLLHCPQAG